MHPYFTRMKLTHCPPGPGPQRACESLEQLAGGVYDLELLEEVRA